MNERQGMMIMKLFSRWKKGNTHTLSQNNKPIINKNKHNLFDDIVGFDDVKYLFKMAIHAERPVHLLLCGPPASAKSLFMHYLPALKDLTMQLEVVLQNQEYLIICLSKDRAIL